MEDEKAGGLERATFAGGCFWCMEPLFDRLDGVVSTAVGYTGGRKENPTYEEVSAGRTGHVEAIEIVFDPSKISYKELLDIFLENIDPATANRQFVDIGTQYSTVVFYHGEEQRREAEKGLRALRESGRFAHIMTEMRPAGPFYKAEDYHQKYYVKSPSRYEIYKKGSGREDFLKRVWGGG